MQDIVRRCLRLWVRRGANSPCRLREIVGCMPPLNLRYIGEVESKQGLKVAVLMTDRNEILTGQAGQIVGNRYKIGCNDGVVTQEPGVSRS